MTLKLSNKIKFVISDFDGVFTDGSVYISESNEVQKKLNFKDIMGVSMLIKNGYNFGIISGEKSNILNYFKDKFNIVEIHGGIRHKGVVLTEIMEKYNLKADEVLYIGDDNNAKFFIRIIYIHSCRRIFLRFVIIFYRCIIYTRNI